jgi:NitT/TauT family transport system ATP-binding protein
VISPRPGQIVRQLAVPLPRPRTMAVREGPEFHRLVDEVRHIFRGYGVI